MQSYERALQNLKDGNKRYRENKMAMLNISAEDKEMLKYRQQPFAVILTCSDSRVSPEIYFDQQFGSIFVIRNAGNIADTTTLGSIEYAIQYLEVKLVVVVGHKHCGAVTGAFDGGEFSGNLQTIISTIESVIKGCEDLDSAIYANIKSNVERIRSCVDVMVMGAFYNLESGEVLWNLNS